MDIDPSEVRPTFLKNQKGSFFHECLSKFKKLDDFE